MNKSSKRITEAHVSNTNMPMGDYYGTGIKQKTCTLRDDYMGRTNSNPNSLKTPPRSLA